MINSRKSQLPRVGQHPNASPYAYEVPAQPTGTKPSTSAAPDGAIEVLVPLPEQNFWYGGGFTAPASMQNMSRNATERLREEHDDTSAATLQAHWPWRVRLSQTTGLPFYVRTFLRNSAPKSWQDASARAWEFMEALGGSIVPALFGTDQQPHQLFFDQTDIVSNDLGDIGVKDTDDSAQRFHISYQQRQSGNLPVLGGQITMHLAQGQPRVSFISTLFPISPARTFTATIAPDQAIAIAWQALRHYDQDTLMPEQPVLSGDLDCHTSDLPLAKWNACINRRADSRLVIVPFAGNYQLAYEVYITAPGGVATWSLFVNAEQPQPQVLGRPMNLCSLVPTRVFANSNEVLGLVNATGMQPSKIVELNGNPCDPFLNVLIDTGNNTTQTPPWQDAALGSPEFDANNVAIHAKLFYDYLLQCGAKSELLDDAHPGRQLSTLVATTGSEFAMGFNAAVQMIHFQIDSGSGLTVSEVNKRVYRPAGDPEVIYHEVAHALMWKLNGDPFEHLVGAAPFASSLREGYANYFAHSCGLGANNPSPSNLIARWAEGAFQSKAGWMDRWALDRDTNQPDEDRIAILNLYPSTDVGPQDLKAYDVGMVWARALWDIRQLIGPAEADRLALNAYLFARGWVTSYEATAEGLLEETEHDPGRFQSFQSLLAARGILASQGIQALAADGSAILVGADAGLDRNDNGQGWTRSDVLDGSNERLSHVVALTAKNGTVYAATPNGVFNQIAAAAGWKKAGTWPAEAAPLSLTVASDDRLYVGSGAGIQVFDPLNQTWAKLPGFDGLALDLAASEQGSPLTLWVAAFASLQQWQPNGTWQQPMLVDADEEVTCVAVAGECLFIGTTMANVWMLMPFAGAAPPINPITSSALGRGKAAVLCLAPESAQRVYAGTTSGLFQGDQEQRGWRWSQVRGLPTSAVVTKLLLSRGTIYAGTARHGLWLRQATSWAAAPETDAVVSNPSIPLLQANQPLAILPKPPAAQTPQPQAYFYPFQLARKRSVTIQLAAAHEVWSLEINPQQQDMTKKLNPGLYTLIVRSLPPYNGQISLS